MSTPDVRTDISLGEALPLEMARVRDEVLPEYLALRGVPGVSVEFGIHNIRECLDLAAKAMAEGDVVAMMRAYVALKGCE